MERSLLVRQNGRELADLQSGFADVLVEAGDALQGLAIDFLWIQNSYGFMEAVEHHLDRGEQIGIAADDHGAFEGVVERIHQKMRSDVYVGALFLRFNDLDKRILARVGGGPGHPRHVGEVVAENEVDVGQGLERPEIEQLALGLGRIVCACLNAGGEVLDARHGILRNHGPAERHGVQPFVGRVFEGAIVEVEGVDINNGFHLPPKEKARTGSCEPALHPFAEATGGVLYK